MIHTLLSWQARAAGERRRVAPWKRSIHSIMSEEARCSDSAACVLKSAHLTSAAANPLTSCSQQLATLAREVSMQMARAGVLVWCAGVALDQHSAGVNGHEAQQTKENGSAVWISLNDREKKKSYCVKKSQFTDLLPTPDCALSRGPVWAGSRPSTARTQWSSGQCTRRPGPPLIPSSIESSHGIACSMRHIASDEGIDAIG